MEVKGNFWGILQSAVQKGNLQLATETHKIKKFTRDATHL